MVCQRGIYELAERYKRRVITGRSPVYVILYAAMIIFFCFFYTALVFNPRETAENLKKSGAFIPGIRPGEQTARYIERIMLRAYLGRCDLCDACMLAARIPDIEMECTVLFWWDFAC